MTHHCCQEHKGLLGETQFQETDAMKEISENTQKDNKGAIQIQSTPSSVNPDVHYH